ncbi:MAG: hypothetical protein ACR2F9_09830, partial [Longimicrobiaceae bacterium]
MTRAFRLCCALLLLASPVVAQAAPQPKTAVDWAALQEETARVLSEYLRIDTSNPPGNELEGARFLKGILDR